MEKPRANDYFASESVVPYLTKNDIISSAEPENVQENNVLQSAEQINPVEITYPATSLVKDETVYFSDEDIIEENIPIYLLDDVRLPISLTKKLVIRYKNECVTLTENEMTDLARQNTSRELSRRLSSSELLRLGTDGYFIDGAYFMQTEFVCIEDIGEELKFEISEH